MRIPKSILIGLLLLTFAHPLAAQWIGFGLATRPGIGYNPRGRGHPPIGIGWGWGGGWGGGRGWGTSHHSFDGGSGGFRSAPLTGYSTGNLSTIDRSTTFTGSSSQTTTHLPPLAPTPYATLTSGKQNDPPYLRNYNRYWHKGYWGGGQLGWGRWGPDGIWSIARWWLGPLYFNSGYATFHNPFVVEQPNPPPRHLDYSRLLENIPNDNEPSTSATEEDQPEEEDTGKTGRESIEEIRKYRVRSPAQSAGLKSFDAATDAFQAGDLAAAQKHIDAALTQLPLDPALHEFRGLVLFAREDYQGAAAAIYSVLSVSPGWNWTTLSGLYGDSPDYQKHLRKLEAYAKQHPESAAAAFLRGYHYMTCRHPESAVKQFQMVVKAFPEDRFFPQLLSLVIGSVEPPESPGQPATKPETPEARPAEQEPARTAIAAVRLKLGDWRAQQGESTVIRLHLGENEQFLWTATQQGAEPRVISGAYTQNQDVLYLAGGHGMLIGRIESRPGGVFMFTLRGNQHAEPGLEFIPEGSR
jgi:hypothetical protein